MVGRPHGHQAKIAKNPIGNGLKQATCEVVSPDQ